MIWLRAVSFVLLVQVTVVGIIPWWLSRSGPRLALGPWRLAGLVPLAIGIALLAVCNVRFVREGRGTAAPYDPPPRLVIQGPYRYARNPMYLSASLIVIGLGLWLQAPWLLGWAAVITIAYNLFVRYYEEPHLRSRFGAEYAAYLREVPRWWPRLP